MKKRRINIPIYGGDLIIYQTDDFTPLFRRYKVDEKYAEGGDAFALRVKNMRGLTEYIMIFNTKATPKIIAHEAVHICNYVFHDLQISPDPINDEPQAYFIEWVVGQVYKIINKVY